MVSSGGLPSVGTFNTKGVNMFTTLGFWGYLGIVLALAVMVWVLYLWHGLAVPQKKVEEDKRLCDGRRG